MSAASEERAARERLLQLAAAAAPPPLAATDARRMARQALLAGAARRKAAGERTSYGLALVGLAAVALVVIGVRLSSEWAVTRGVPAPPPSSSPLRMQLPSRDTLVAAPGAQFELASAHPHDRRIELRGGAIAFDVAPLGAGERFVVATPHLTVRVHGTVFSVAVSAGRTQVRAYEGVVAVEHAGRERLLRAGENLASDGSAVKQDYSAPLQREAAELAAGRKHAPVRAASAPAKVAPAVARAPAAVQQVPAPARPTPAQIGEHLEQARAWLHAGEAERALAAARRTRERANGSASRGDWLLLEADALRSLNRAAEAAPVYRAAAQALRGELRTQAGFKAADLFMRELDDPRAALAALHAAGVDAPSSALRERGLLLRIEALQRLGEPIAEVADRYLAEFPDSAGAPRLRAQLDQER